MKFSESKRYIDYMNAFAEEAYGLARAALEECLNESGSQEYERAFLLQRLGEIAFLEGRETDAIQYYQAAEKADPDSLQPKYMFAKFLARRLGRIDDAIKKCEEILQIANTFPFEPTEEDFGSEYYVSKVSELKVFCETRQRSAE